LNIWLWAGVALALVLLVVAIGMRRPRRAEDELLQPNAEPIGIDTPSSLGPVGLRAVLRSMQTGRETGTLLLTSADRTGSLYFLFGHLFHAVCGTLTGERALQECLTWQDFRYTFDKTAQLPTEETIERPIDQILG
jgi:hypothetical protein